MRRHPVFVSVMALVLMSGAVKFGPTIFFAALIFSMAVLGISGGARRKIPVRDLALYVGISLLLVIAILVWAETSSRGGR